MSIVALLTLAALVAVALAGIGLTVLYKNARLADKKASHIERLAPNRKTSEEQFAELLDAPFNFAGMQSVEKIGILNSKIEVGEELARSGGKFVDPATHQLVLLYGALSRLQDLEGINSEKTYRKLAELRQQALAAGNEERVAVADFLRAYSATSRLNQYTEEADFRFAVDSVLNLDSKDLLNPEMILDIYVDAIKLHDTSSEQDSTASFLSILGDKLSGSPVSEISDLGLSLKDYPRYAQFYTAMDKDAFPTRESKLQFFRKLFEAIENAPPQSLQTYEITIRSFDNLLNQSDAKYAGELTKRLGKAASMVSPKIKTYVDQAIESIEKRIAAIGRTANLSGADAAGKPLALPNGKSTVLVFWDARVKQSSQYLDSLATSHQFDAWATNVLIASTVELSGEQYKQISKQFRQFITLDYATSRRMMEDLGVDYVPYQVTIDNDGKVIRLGALSK